MKKFERFLTSILPGLFVALALRFDVSRGKESQYFRSAFVGYVVGLVLAIIVMHWFEAAQVNLSFPQNWILFSEHIIIFIFVFSFLVLFLLSNGVPYYGFSISFQPALLYIVPAVIGFLAAHCIWNGDVKPVSYLYS